MRDKLKEYVSLLFAGIPGSEEMQEEILQNTLDRFDDLISQGKSPEAAYRLAITGIGDLSEILNVPASLPNCEANVSKPAKTIEAEISQDHPLKAFGRAIAIGLYIICLLPLFLLSEFGMDTVGLCGSIAIVAVATVLIILCRKNEVSEEENHHSQRKESELRKSLGSLIWAVGLAVYFIVSFTTGAWYITWVVFPLTGAAQGLVKAILDLKEV